MSNKIIEIKALHEKLEQLTGKKIVFCEQQFNQANIDANVSMYAQEMEKAFVQFYKSVIVQHQDIIKNEFYKAMSQKPNMTFDEMQKGIIHIIAKKYTDYLRANYEIS